MQLTNATVHSGTQVQWQRQSVSECVTATDRRIVYFVPQLAYTIDRSESLWQLSWHPHYAQCSSVPRQNSP